MNRQLFFTLALSVLACVGLRAELYINEVNSTGKWIEIYNSGNAAVNVGEYRVIRENNDDTSNAATIPTGTTIAAKGFLVLYQSEAGAPVANAIDCLPFGISSDKFYCVILKDVQDNIIDDSFEVGFPQRAEVTYGKSWARKTDGGRDIVALEPTPGKSNPLAPLPPSVLKIYVNEVNSTGKWIELYNAENDTIDISGFKIARFNNDHAITQNPIPAGTKIPANGFLVLYQGAVALPPVEDAVDCLTFGISSDKFWHVMLRDEAYLEVDKTFDIGNPQTVKVNSGKSWAREIDGDPIITVMEPTPGKSNTSLAEVSDLKIYINEVNPNRKWIEIYNAEDSTVQLGGYTITRNNNDGGVGIAYIPEGTTLAAKGFLVLYQGGTVASPITGAIDCLPFGISIDKFQSAILKDDEGRLVDNTFDIGFPQTVLVSGKLSWAREADGDSTIVELTPTPGKSNNLPYEKADLKMYINEVNASGKWIEIYNDEEEDIQMCGFSIIRTNNDDAIGVGTIKDSIILKAKDFLIVYQETVAKPVEGAVACLPFGISADKFMGVLLVDAQNRLVDSTFQIGYPQTVVVSGTNSWGRKLDGCDLIVALPPTPGYTNDDGSSNAFIHPTKRVLAKVMGRTLLLPENTTQVQVYSLTGQLVTSKRHAVNSIHLADLSQGVYIIKMLIAGELYSQKIVLTGY